MMTSIDCCYKVSIFPSFYNEAIQSKNNKKWQVAMEDETQSLRDNDTFTLPCPPEGKNIIWGRWVYTVKYDVNNQERFKARFVARSYS